MKTVQMSKLELINILKQNKETHIDQYNQALDGWQGEYRDSLKFHAETVMNGHWDGNDTFYFSEPKPVSYAESYESAISQLQHDIRDTIEISQEDYKRYVLDNWEWRGNFMRSTMKYID